jgi:superfamily II DNA or RNA helicase
VRVITWNCNQNLKDKFYLLDKFNAVKNRYGKNYQVLLITDAGSEGINVIETRHIHIVESNTRFNKIKQVIGRVVRYNSHINMKEDERNVNVWFYWTVWNQEQKEGVYLYVKARNNKGKIEDKEMFFEEREMIDEILYKKAKTDEKKINGFLKILQETSIEYVDKKPFIISPAEISAEDQVEQEDLE